MKKLIIILILFATVLLNAKTWVREYTYNTNDADSKITSRAIALEQVKRLLHEELGVYVHSTLQSEEIETSGELKELTAKQIEIISVGVTETKILEENWYGETYYIKAEITADKNDIINRLNKIMKDKEKTEQIEDSRKRTEEIFAEIERLKTELAQTQNVNEKLKIQNKYNKSSSRLSAEDWFQKGYNAAEMGEYNNVILYNQKAIEINPDCAEAYVNMGNAYNKIDNYEKAIECYQKAIEIDPDYEIPFNNLGCAYNKKGNYDKAIECLEKAIEINPYDAEAYFNMGTSYRHKGKYDKVVEYNPDDAEAYINFGGAYFKQSNYKKIIECCEKVIVLNPNNADAYINLGIAYDTIGNNKKSIEYYIKAARLGHKYSQDWLRENGISW